MAAEMDEKLADNSVVVMEEKLVDMLAGMTAVSVLKLADLLVAMLVASMVSLSVDLWDS